MKVQGLRQLLQPGLVLSSIVAALVAGSPVAGAPLPPTAPVVAASVGLKCAALPKVAYTLGPKRDVDDLYPMIRTAAMSDYDTSMAIAANIQFYLQNSLKRDHVNDACGLAVVPNGDAGYAVSFHSADPRASSYGAAQQAWLGHGQLALAGIKSCQQDSTCWEPSQPAANVTCAGPWQFYLPLGLPMIAQKMVMLLHYPPYSAMQQSDYVNNATLNRWHRLLKSVGVTDDDWTSYTTTVDIFPIAAPGSGETGCFSTAAAIKHFGAPGSGYIPAMLNGLALRPDGSSNGNLPVIIFGGEAIGYWNAANPGSQTAVLKAGSVALDPAKPANLTPFMGANHPIAAVYQDCVPPQGSAQPGIVAMVKQDLTTACFARTMAATPGGDPVKVAASCQATYFAAKPGADVASQICVNAVIDKSPQYTPWNRQQAETWCAKNKNTPCPLPNY